MEVREMERTLASELERHVGATVRLAGWLHHTRTLSKVSFVLLRDRGGISQVVVEDDALRDAVNAMLHETVIEVTGMVVANAQAPGGYEVGPRVDQHGVVRTGVEQGGDLGGGGAHAVRQQRQGRQDRTGIRISGEQQELHVVPPLQ
jgi:hypothetical protein